MLPKLERLSLRQALEDDHRDIDDAHAARLVRRVCDGLEDPSSLLLND